MVPDKIFCLFCCCSNVHPGLLGLQYSVHCAKCNIN
uniref:Uncharacterized protein n=1 Tax=Anguilla anguilla TaxID=7936 RepID=A0A0E9V563_ANGAN